MVVAVYEAKLLGLEYRPGNVPGSDPELLELTLRSFEQPISPAGVFHVLKEQEVDEAARIDAGGPPCVAFSESSALPHPGLIGGWWGQTLFRASRATFWVRIHRRPS